MALTVGAHLDEAGFVQDAQMARHARLMDLELLHHVVYLLFALTQGFDDAPAGWVGDDLEDVWLRHGVYVS